MKLKGRSKSSKVIEVRSDIHDMSSTAVCSESPYVSETDTYIKPNKLQQVLGEAWDDCTDALSKKADLLVINGEPIDGANKKQVGQQSWTTNIEDGMQDFMKLAKRCR